MDGKEYKLSKAKIEEMANKIMQFLLKNNLEEDVYIYYNNKRQHMSNQQMVIEDNICPLDYFKYVNTHHILSMSFEGALYRELNDMTKKSEQLQQIFDKYNVYYELGNAWNLTVCPSNITEEEIEYTDYTKESAEKYPTEAYIYIGCDNVPPVLSQIMQYWYLLSEKVGDKGSCVLGAGFKFYYQDTLYKMASCSPWQGSLSWEAHLKDIRMLLEAVGCTNIKYDYGCMD